MTVKLEQVIVADLTRKGNGGEFPVRVVTEVYDTQGNLIAANDPLSYDVETIVRFANHLLKGLSPGFIEYRYFDNWINEKP